MYSDIYNKVQKKWDSIAKPIDGLGSFEKLICKIGAIQNSTNINIDRKAVVVFCSDNGVVSEGVAQTDNSVTALVAENITKGISTVAKMAKTCGCDSFAVDVGIATEVDNVINKNISRGTKNIAKEPAMTVDEAKKALQAGIDTISELKQKGYNIVALGEMGIGNTTTAAAISSVLLNMPAEQVTGKGSGLTDKGLENKINVVKSAVELHKPNDLWETVSSLGGYDIIAMAGAVLGAKRFNMPVIIDGAVSAVSALIAFNLDCEITKYILPSHLGKEPVSAIIMERLGLEPVIHGNMALGEGSGGVMLLPLLDMALAVYNNKTFDELEMESYKRC